MSIYVRLVSITVCLLAVAVPASATSYSGKVTMPQGLTGIGSWTAGETVIDWTVSQQPDPGLWHYSYTLTVPDGELSYFIVEVPAGLPLGDILNASVTAAGQPLAGWGSGHEDIWIGAFAEAKVSPGMPGEMIGLKFDNLEGTSATVEFDVDLAPTWGDVYLRGNKSKELKEYRAAWNEGFEDGEPAGQENDPIGVPPRDGIVLDHLLVPDPPPSPASVPEPLTMAGMAGAIGCVGAYVRRRRAA